MRGGQARGDAQFAHPTSLQQEKRKSCNKRPVRNKPSSVMAGVD